LESHALLERVESGANRLRFWPAENYAPKYRAVTELVADAAERCVAQFLVLDEDRQAVALNVYVVV
jgi:hypothetical protein